jgi:hypothetical protein
MQQPSYLDTVLYGLVMELGKLPRDAYPERERGRLPPPMRWIVERTPTEEGQSWGCWTDDNHYWLFIAKLPLTRGTPILHLRQYDEAGELQETTSWSCDDKDQWQRAAAS